MDDGAGRPHNRAVSSSDFDERAQLHRAGRGIVWRGRRPSEIAEGIEGLDLARCLRAAGPFAIDRAVDVVRQLLAALEVVHGEGTVHADVQPCNVIIEPCPGGEIVSLVDFGGHNALDGGSGAYLAPEVISGGAPTAASDLYAVGVILHELLTGQPPYIGRNAVEVMMHQLKDSPPPPSRLRPEVAALDVVCVRAMARQPRDRFPDARTFASALAEAMTELTIDDAWGWSR